MWRSILIALTALLAAPAAAQACDSLPAGFAEELTVRNGLHQGRTAEREPTLLCVKAGGRRIVLRRAQFEDPYEGRAHGTVIAAAAAAGRKVAWIETRLTRERRSVVVRVVRSAPAAGYARCGGSSRRATTRTGRGRPTSC